MAKGHRTFQRYGEFLANHHRLIIGVVLFATALLGGGILLLDGDIRMAQFEVDSPEREAMDYVEANFASTDHEVTVIVVHGDDVLNQETVGETMWLQQAVRENETIQSTLADDASTIGIGNAIAYASDDQLTDDGSDIEQKIDEIEELDEDRLVENLEDALHTDDIIPGDRPRLATLLPADYEPGENRSEATLVLVVQDENVDEEDLLAAQLAIDDIVGDEIESSDAFVFGEALTFERGAAATGESFAIVGPLAVLLVLTAMVIFYRDPYDIALGVTGVAGVLVWLGGYLGWTGIGMNQLLVAVPCLLVGLSIDHGFHVVMRYREASSTGNRPRLAMTHALSGVIIAIGMTTVTTMIGFLSGLVSPIAILREFGLASAFGILAAFVMFGALVPALRIEFADRGWERRTGRTDAIGRRPRIQRIMHFGLGPVRRSPLTVIAVSLLLASGGVYGLASIDTSTDRTDFLPGEQPTWTNAVPEELRPSEQTLREEAIFLEDTFDRDERHSVTILIEGDPTDPATLRAVESAEAAAIEASTLTERTDGRPVIYSPIDALEEIARNDDQVAEALERSDSTNDGIPDQHVAELYDDAFESDPTMMREVVHRDEGAGTGAVRLVVTVEGGADENLVRWEMNQVVEAASESEDRHAIATGEPILAGFQDRAVALTAFGTFLTALAVISVLLTIIFRHRYDSWSLGVVTIAPVLIALAWVIGVMSMLSIPYNAETAIITGIAIGIGVDYAIHVTERFMLERREHEVDRAINIAVVQTGGTLLASVITTALGFVALVLTFVPSLQRFGAITALLVALAFVTSVVLLPALLIVWARQLDH